MFNHIEFRCLIYAILCIPVAGSAPQQKNSVGLCMWRHQREHPAVVFCPEQTATIIIATQLHSDTRIWYKHNP